ncbi:hypothetical protein BU15DRAFT_68283 [Melanogaster broomeanus]|nr:hypothetical protein BU15DRAFT_68283 [Melanogaster broomeanus]
MKTYGGGFLPLTKAWLLHNFRRMIWTGICLGSSMGEPWGASSQTYTYTWDKPTPTTWGVGFDMGGKHSIAPLHSFFLCNSVDVVGHGLCAYEFDGVKLVDRPWGWSWERSIMLHVHLGAQSSQLQEVEISWVWHTLVGKGYGYGWVWVWVWVGMGMGMGGYGYGYGYHLIYPSVAYGNTSGYCHAYVWNVQQYMGGPAWMS